MAAVHACLPVLLIAMWPKYRRGMVPVAVLACVLAFVAAWFIPGPLTILTSMAVVGAAVRASDVSRTLPVESSRLKLALTSFFLTRHPLDPPRPQVDLAPGWRMARGALLLVLCFGLDALGTVTQPWRISPYLHDLLLAVQLGLGSLGSVEIITPVARRLGLTELWIFFESLSPGFGWPRSLRNFWSNDWNRPVSGMLRRGVFDAVGGRRRLALAVLATFLVSGLMHGPQLAFAAGGEQRAAWMWLAVLGTLWFVVHGVACLLEGALNRGSRRRWLGRVIFYATFLLTVPCYPAPLFIAFNIHGRTVDQATPVILLRWAGVL